MRTTADVETLFKILEQEREILDLGVGSVHECVVSPEMEMDSNCYQAALRLVLRHCGLL